LIGRTPPTLALGQGWGRRRFQGTGFVELIAKIRELAEQMVAEGGAIGGYGQQLLTLIGERPCVCTTPNCGCSHPSVAVCRSCGGRVALRVEAGK
jgi:hypothetical protein